MTTDNMTPYIKNMIHRVFVCDNLKVQDKKILHLCRIYFYGGYTCKLFINNDGFTLFYRGSKYHVCMCDGQITYFKNGTVCTPNVVWNTVSRIVNNIA